MSRFLCFDTETSGLKPESGDRLIEVALVTYDSDTRKATRTYVQRLDPECSISSGAQAVHGIAYADLVGKPRFRDVAAEIHAQFEAADMVIAHNLPFDATFFLYEFQAAGLKLPSKPSVDTMGRGRWATPNGKLPRLGELCFALGVKYDAAAAHSALYDVERTIECFWRGLDRGFYTLPEGL